MFVVYVDWIFLFFFPSSSEYLSIPCSMNAKQYLEHASKTILPNDSIVIQDMPYSFVLILFCIEKLSVLISHV